MNCFRLSAFNNQKTCRLLANATRFLGFSLLCFNLVGCAGFRRESHVLCASTLGFVGDYRGGQRQFVDAYKIDLAHIPKKVVPDCDMLVWYDGCSGRPQDVLPHCQQALENCRKFNDLNGEGWVYNLVGRDYLLRAVQWDQALTNFEHALTIYRQAGISKGVANSLSGLGTYYDLVNQYGKALECHDSALLLYRKSGDKSLESDSLNSIGAEYYTLGQYDKALEYFQQALALQPIYSGTRFFPAIKIPALYESAISHDHLAQTYSVLGRHKKAIHEFKIATLYYTIFRGGTPVDWCFNRLGLEYQLTGQHRKALFCYKWSLFGMNTWHKGEGTRDSDGCCLRNMGFTYESLGQRDKALKCYEKSLSMLRAVKDRPSEANTLDTLMSYWKESKPDLAVFYGKQAVNTYQDIRGNLQSLDKEIQKGYLASHESTYRKLADLLITQGRLSEAEQVLNMLKEDEYYQFVRRDSNQASSLNARAELTPTEAQWEQKLEQANAVFQSQLDQLDAEAGAPNKSDTVGAIREAQGLMDTLGELGSGAVALYTVVCDDKYHVILITPERQTAAEYTIKSSDLNRKVMAFREALANPALDPEPLAKELYQILVGPVAKDLEDAKAQTLMWSLDGVLRYLPMAALSDGQHYLVEKYRNVVFTPASESRLKDPVSAEWKGLGLGVSKAHENFPALPGVQEELHGIIQDNGTSPSLGIVPGTVLMDESFTADSMLASLHRKFSLVHIASHFQFKPGNETSSFLLLGDGSHLTLERIKNLPNIFGGVELLTLSACDTATSGEDASGKEFEGFAVLAQRQGAKAVLASLWPVADQSTQLLMQEFYRLREATPGMLKAEALREAQLDLLHGTINGDTFDNASRGVKINDHQTSSTSFPFNSGAPYSHPYYWSPFILIGNWK